jgi:hypothetical protein
VTHQNKLKQVLLRNFHETKNPDSYCMHQRHPNRRQNRNKISRNDTGQQINMEAPCCQETRTLIIKETNWLIGRKSPLTVENKILIYKTIYKTYGLERWGCASNSNKAIIQRTMVLSLMQHSTPTSGYLPYETSPNRQAAHTTTNLQPIKTHS